MNRLYGPAIKGILFDLDGTLYHQFPLRILMMSLLLFKHINQPSQLIRKIKIIKQFRKSQELLRKNTDTSGNSYQNQILLTAKSSGETKEFISQVIAEWFEKKPLNFIKLCRRQKMVNILSSLREKGYKLGVYSDYPANDKLKAMGIFDHFQVIVCSNDPDVTGFKPHTNGFGLAAEKLGLDPAEIIYIGDRPDVDGKGAKDAGMKYINISENLEQQLSNLIKI